ncbi:unnamed protein product [Moneuplotes crassus]|uniref:Uncharacterized protein n=1 Tax=Euplotes crassus TaxID=5936 RepID=A0AAD1UU65_EUPCR|nr:unnamed protein product [Moneuplotes crassus]
MESNNKVIEEENAGIISLEKSVLAKTKKQDIARCQSILYKIFPEQREIQPLDSDSGEVPENRELYINPNTSRYMKLAQNFKYLKFFDTVSVSFDDVDSKKRHFVNFLESSFPDKTNRFYFHSSSKMKLKRSNYLNSLLRISSKVLQVVSFYHFCIGLPSLKRLVAAYKHVRVLGLWACTLSIPSAPDFSEVLSNCQIQKLDLSGSGCSYSSDLENNFDEFKNLVQGLVSSPDLRLSLEEVVICDCLINKDEAEETFEENQLGRVKIIA